MKFDEVIDVLSEVGCEKIRPYEGGEAEFDEAMGVLSEIGYDRPAPVMGYWVALGGRI